MPLASKGINAVTNTLTDIAGSVLSTAIDIMIITIATEAAAVGNNHAFVAILTSRSQASMQESMIMEASDATTTKNTREALIVATMWNMTCLRVARSGDCAIFWLLSFTDGATAIVHAIVTKVFDVVSGHCESGHDSNRYRNLLHLFFFVIFMFYKQLPN